MIKLIDTALDQAWQSFPQHLELNSPTERAQFAVTKIDTSTMKVETAKVAMNIHRRSFAAALDYLITHGHFESSPCEIRSTFDAPGPLSQATAAGKTITITYVLPILQNMGLVEIGRNIPSTTWLAEYKE